MATENSRDGIRRHEDLIKEVERKADEALALAVVGNISETNAILSIEHGGTGSDVKNFVDLSTNQFNILGSKIFKASCGFQKESDVVNSGEIAGNVRLISCDEPGADIGPQLRFSGRHSTGDLTAFAFATIAGRKENDTCGDRSGYLQLATTEADGTIAEAARINSEHNMGIGAIPAIGAGNRLHVSGGDILLDRQGGNRIIKLELGDTVGRVQSLQNLDSPDSEHMLLSVNSLFSSGACMLDTSTAIHGSAAIDIRTNGVGATEAGGMIRMLVGDVDDCPSERGRFTVGGLEVTGETYSTRNIVSGGLANVVGGIGNATTDVDGFVTGDNIHAGAGAPEGVVHAPIGAIYHRLINGGSDAPDENSTLWVKVFDDGGNTGWLPVQVGIEETSICVQANCPTFSESTEGDLIPDCQVWFDSVRGIWFYWDSEVLRTAEPERKGAWLSVQLYHQTVEVTGRSHTQQFRGQIDKDYEYITPVQLSRYKMGMFLVDLTASLRQSNNGNDRLKNYYTFDLITLKQRQGDPNANRSTRQEWPGDREPYETKRDNLRGDGHTYHENLSDNLIALSSQTPSGPPADGVGTVTAVGSTRRVLLDSSKSWTSGQWKERENDDSQNGFSANNGFQVTMLTGEYAGVKRTIRNNTSNSLVLRRPWPRLSSGTTRPAIGDEYEILDSQHKRIIARVSTKGNVYADGAHVDPDQDRTADPPPLFTEYSEDDNGNTVTRSQATTSGRYKTRDVQDFTQAIMNGLDANSEGGRSANPTDEYIPIDLYIDPIGQEESTEGTDVEPTDAVIVAGLWDAVRRPGKISGSISLSYRLALPPSTCEEGALSK